MGETPRVTVGAGPGSIRTGADQVVPFHSRASPPPVTAMQNVSDTQETPVKGEVLPDGSGTVHCPPSHWESPPEAETQNVDETHDMAETEPQSPLVRVHDEPL